MTRGFINIDYDEPKIKTYRGVHLSIDEITYKFNSGNFVKDWFRMTKFIAFSDLTGASMSSSFDHFFMDGAKFISAFLVKISDDKYDLKYDASFTEQKDLLEFFVPKGKHLNWEELKEYCEIKVVKQSNICPCCEINEAEVFCFESQEKICHACLSDINA